MTLTQPAPLLPGQPCLFLLSHAFTKSAILYVRNVADQQFQGFLTLDLVSVVGGYKNQLWIVVFCLNVLTVATKIWLHFFFHQQRFIQYLASRNTLFNLNNYLDKSAMQGKDPWLLFCSVVGTCVGVLWGTSDIEVRVLWFVLCEAPKNIWPSVYPKKVKLS